MGTGLERFLGPDGVERVRLTPSGARAIGEEQLAIALEECKGGRHQFTEAADVCVCGETVAPR